MSHFIQLHLLTAYPPSNLNRDDLGRPKTALVGGATRLRVSSQSLKRAWRESAVFEESLGEYKGTRTRRFGRDILKVFKEKGIADKKATEWARAIAGEFGELEKDKGNVDIRQLAHLNPAEKKAALELAAICAAEERAPEKEELKGLRQKASAVDIGLFGRMLASAPDYNVDAACQVAHAITVHAKDVEDDYFTAVDDLNSGEEDRGAGHIGQTGFGAGLFYLYICVDRQQLIDNLQGDEALADKSIQALAQAAATVSPKGKQNSFGSRAFASYLLAEKGDQQPRSLAAAFLKPVKGEDQVTASIEKLKKQYSAFDKAYGKGADSRFEVIATTDYQPTKEEGLEAGSLDGLLEFIGK